MEKNSSTLILRTPNVQHTELHKTNREFYHLNEAENQQLFVAFLQLSNSLNGENFVCNTMIQLASVN
jgi:hypothetical protein